jgi:hypothetical protein
MRHAMKNTIKCPCCLVNICDKDRSCPSCRFALPLNYYQNCIQAPPLPIAAIGYSGHGKSHLLNAIVLTLRQLSGCEFPVQVTLEVADDHTLGVVAAASAKAEGEALDPTPRQNSRTIPLILRASGLFPPRTLLVYDVAGESFESLTAVHEHLPVLREIQTVWFVLSPDDLQKPARAVGGGAAARDLGFLFTAYKNAMIRLEAPLEGRNAVIVVSKGDKLSGEGVSELKEYLETDPYCAGQIASATGFDLKAYEEGIRQVAHRVEPFVTRIKDVRNLVGLLKGSGMTVNFCVTAALGHDPIPGPTGKVTLEWCRQRALDPLVWTLVMERQPDRNSLLHVLVDVGSDSARAYPAVGGRPLPSQLWESLSNHQKVRFSFLGRTVEGLAPGQQPPEVPPSVRRLPLIGPMLEPLRAENSLVGKVVLVTNSVVLDLPDFDTKAWRSRIILVTSSDRPEVRSQWRRVQVIESAEDLAHVVDFMNSNPEN